MGYESITAQGLSAPPYLVAYMVVLMATYYSDKRQSRAEFVVFFASMACAGYVVLAVSKNIATRYLAIFFVATGFFSVVTIIVVWTINNQSSESSKGTGVVVLNTIGQCGPLVGTRLYPDSDGPYYEKGMTICALSMLTVAILAILLRRHLANLNAQSDKEEYYRLVSSADDADDPTTGNGVPSMLDEEDEAEYEQDEMTDELSEAFLYETISADEARQLREDYGFEVEIVDDEKSVEEILKMKAKFVARKRESAFKYIL